MLSNLITSFLKIILLLSIVSYFYSCSSTTTKQEANKNYKMDISINDNEGTLVLKNSPSYKISLESDGRINLLTIKSCSRQMEFEDPRKGLSRKKFEFTYTPNEIEKDAACPLEIWSYEVAGRHSAGFLDFEDPYSTLPYINICGDKTFKTNGVGICQNKENLSEKIKFDTEVTVEKYVGCDKIKSEKGTNTGKEFEYTLSKGFCVWTFSDDKNKKTARLTTYGYEELIIRAD